MLQEPLRESVARFMAYVHTSVNQASRQYLQSDRRYNYTTPKSFLEQISLYSRLLTTKNAELAAKVGNAVTEECCRRRGPCFLWCKTCKLSVWRPTRLSVV